jgi:hypothetical protein
MAAIDFPASPTVGQIFVAGNGVSYQWTGTLWIPIGGTQALFVGDTPPASPGPNQLWWNSTSGQMYLWYNDGNSTQWVPAMPTLPVGVPAPVVWRQIGRIVPAAGQPTIDFTSIPADINDIRLSFDVTPTTNQQQIIAQFYDNTGTLDATTAHYTWALEQSYHAMNSIAPTGWGSAAMGGTNLMLMTNPGGASASVGNIYGVRGQATVTDIKTARVKSLEYTTDYLDDAQSYWRIITGCGWRTVASAITGLRLSFNPAFNAGSTFAAGGSATLWGSP